jgi:hypothetical protein
MNEIQKLRNAMFDEIDRIKRGTTTPEESNSIVKAGNVIVQSYNTEIKAMQTMMEMQDRGIELPTISVTRAISE